VKYPANFVDDDGVWWVILQGHKLDHDVIERELPRHLGEKFPEQVLITVEEWFRYVPRVKWCSSLDGFGCDQEGEWHGHWTGVIQNESNPHCKFTVARWGDPKSTDSR